MALAFAAVLPGCSNKAEQPVIGARKAPVLEVKGLQFKDLNKNGKLDVYEDWRQPIEKRIENLLSQMTLEEKAGMMVHPNCAITSSGYFPYDDPNDPDAVNVPQAGGPGGPGGPAPMAGPGGPGGPAPLGQNEKAYAGPVLPDGTGAAMMAPGQMRSQVTAKDWIETKNIRCILNNGVAEPEKFANWTNKWQEVAEATRLGIPIMFSTDPRHGAVLGAHVSGKQYFSQWPNKEGQIGITAARDPELLKQFGEAVAEEYRAVGIHMILGPQIDLTTEPRWNRNNGCFSEDADLTSEMIVKYIEGAQGKNVGPDKILVHLKHWPGSGPHENGITDKWLYYPNDNQEYHYKPWKAGFEAGARAAMGYYSGTYYDTLNVNYSYHISTEVLRDQLGFTGVLCTDWGVVGNGPMHPKLQGKTTMKDNIEMIINAGVDQLGAESSPSTIVELVKEGKISEDRIDISVRRILEWHFLLGLFENPYCDPSTAASKLQTEKNQGNAYHAQQASNILLTNDGTLPAKKGCKIYVEGVSETDAAKYATVVTDPSDADLIYVRTSTSANANAWGPVATPLEFPAEKWEHIKGLKAYGKPVVVAFNPTTVTPILPSDVKTAVNATLMVYDVFDTAVLDVLFGDYKPQGKLPYELPSSMQAVLDQDEDLPFDSKDPLFAFGHGLTY